MDELETQPRLIYRSGDPSPSNLRPRPSDSARLSFRDSLSNPIDGPIVFRPDASWFSLDARQLPPDSVVYDGDPSGHVSVIDVPVEVLKNLAPYSRGKCDGQRKP